MDIHQDSPSFSTFQTSQSSFIGDSSDFESDIEDQFDFDFFNQQNALGYLASTQAELESSGLVTIDSLSYIFS